MIKEDGLPNGTDWLEAELEDTLDEDFELEMSEPALSLELRRIYQRKHPETLDRVLAERDEQQQPAAQHQHDRDQRRQICHQPRGFRSCF